MVAPSLGARRQCLIMMAAVSVTMTILCLAAAAVADDDIDDHVHDMDSLPGWYDPNCCNQRDCRPLRDDEKDRLDFTVVVDPWDASRTTPGVLDRTSGYVFTHAQLRKSQDGRFHVCVTQSGQHICVYIPYGL